MLPRNLRQEALCRAYVRAVAARAGVICGGVENDLGFDLLLRSVESHDGQLWDTGAQIDVQLKSTTRAKFRATEVIHDLEVRAYNILRQPDVNRPRILVLLVLPEDEGKWLAQTEEALILRHCAYWLSLRGAEPTISRTTVRIAIPRGNLFTIEALQEMMDRVKEGSL